MSCDTCDNWLWLSEQFVNLFLSDLFPPTVHANTTVIQATLGHTVEFSFNVTDDTAFNVTLRGQPPSMEDYNLTVAGDVVVFVWTPTNTDLVSLLFVATDVDGLSSQIHPLVRLCACRFDKNATCIEAEDDGGPARFVLENCQCGQGRAVAVIVMTVVVVLISRFVLRLGRSVLWYRYRWLFYSILYIWC